MIRKVQISDAEYICRIYNYYVLNTTISFEEIPVSDDQMRSRIEQVTGQYPWLVYVEENNVVGYAYVSRWKERSAYRYSVESAIYLDPAYTGKGIGTILKAELIKDLKENSVHSIIAGIALPNPASIALCEKFGFRKIGQFYEVGYKFHKWIDVGYWELILQ